MSRFMRLQSKIAACGQENGRGLVIKLEETRKKKGEKMRSEKFEREAECKRAKLD